MKRKKSLTTTLIDGNIQWSDDVENKPLNKGHQKKKGGSMSSDLGLSENQANTGDT